MYQVKYFCVLFFMILQFAIAQNDKIQITIQEREEGLIFSAMNDAEVQHEVTLTISVQNLLGYHGPITKMVPAKDSVQMARLSFQENKPWFYETGYTYRPIPTKEEIAEQNEQVKQELFDFLGTEENPIIVFYGEGCSRSEYAKEMLEKKKIRFKYLNTTKSEHFNKVMFELLRLEKPNITRVQFPVFLVNNELDYDIENLRWYIKELASN